MYSWKLSMSLLVFGAASAALDGSVAVKEAAAGGAGATDAELEELALLATFALAPAFDVVCILSFDTGGVVALVADYASAAVNAATGMGKGTDVVELSSNVSAHCLISGRAFAKPFA